MSHLLRAIERRLLEMNQAELWDSYQDDGSLDPVQNLKFAAAICACEDDEELLEMFDKDIDSLIENESSQRVES